MPASRSFTRSIVFACSALLLNTTLFAQQKPAPAPAKPAAPQTRPPAAPQRPSTAKPAAPAPVAAAKPAPPPPDVIVKTEYGAGDKTTTSIVSANGTRQRIEYGGEMTVISQCDTGRVVQINGEHKKFFVSSPAAAASKTGGVVTYTTTVTDTEKVKTSGDNPPPAEK